MAHRSEVEREPSAPTKIRWPEHLAKLLGRLPDAALARRAGVHPSTVMEERRRRGIDPYQPRRPPIEWTEEMIARLGQATDREVAEELGIAVAGVSHKRTFLGIPPHCPPKEDELVRTLPPREAAERTGRSLKAVKHRRRALGLSLAPAHPQLRWTPEVLALLGKVSDGQLAGRLGITRSAVTQKRRRLGIPAHRRAGAADGST